MHIIQSLICTLMLCLMLAACNSSDIGDYSDDPEKSYITTKNYFNSIQVPYGNYGNAELEELTVGRIDLGKKLFYDKRLSKYGDLACSTCHDPKSAFTENNKSLPTGTSAQLGGRNAPSLYDVALNSTFNRDGSAASISSQANGPLTNPLEMANASLEAVAIRISKLRDYQRYFNYAYSGEINGQTISRALASYQYTLLTGPNKFDIWSKNGRKGVLSIDERAGFDLFTGKAGCVSCHTISEKTALFTDHKFHNIKYRDTLDEDLREKDKGRYMVTGNPKDVYAFRTPSLRNVSLTGPYMHDGRISSLEDVISFFDKTQSLGLTKNEKRELEVFLHALTSKIRPNQ